MRKRPLTIREIASETGVSTATVSRVFNTPELVRETTRKKVLAVIDHHHFVSDRLAGSLASRRSHLLGLIIPTITNSIYALSTQSIQQAGQAAGYTVLVGMSEFSAEREAQLVHEFIERRVEGLILTGAERNARVYDKITHNGVPFVVTWRLARAWGLPSVSFDNHGAAAKVVDHLVSLGHRRIGLICMHTDLNDRARGRREGFETRMAEHGLEVDPGLVFERDYEFVEARAAMHQALCHPRPPTAVFCASDVLAIGAIYECRQAGLQVPRDISVVGFDDMPITEYLTPPLTTVRVPTADMGRRAIQELLRAIRGDDIGLGIELPTDLIIRGSTAPAP
ncbi:MAG: LacI family DNA-binding transcriptional regulator [Methyloligellaceae bacterium]